MSVPRLPWCHGIEPKPGDPPTWRCTARACGWNGRWDDALRHVVKFQRDDRPRPVQRSEAA
jgi:hypothetical protein